MATAPAAPKSTDLVPLQTFAIAERPDDLALILRENVGDGRMTPFDLDRVKVPTSGGRTWLVPTLDGDKDERALEGVIVAWREPRAFWEGAFSGGGNPPECSSVDGVIGQGTYGIGSELHGDGQCRTCPMAAWGSKVDEKGQATRGQACKQMRLLFLLPADALLPFAIFCPPTSIAPVRKYFMRLSAQGIPYYGVVTSLALDKATNAGGIDYSQVVPTMAGRLSTDDRETVRRYSAQLQATLDAVVLTSADVADDEGAAEPTG